MTQPCDFCSATSARWAFRTRAFTTSSVLVDETDGQPFVLDFSDLTGVWCACDECKALIVSGERDKLVQRAVTPCDALLGERVPSQAREYVRQLHDDFWRSREGGPVPIEQVEVGS
jgi:hypothetical protein